MSGAYYFTYQLKLETIPCYIDELSRFLQQYKPTQQSVLIRKRNQIIRFTQLHWMDYRCSLLAQLQQQIDYKLMQQPSNQPKATINAYHNNKSQTTIQLHQKSQKSILPSQQIKKAINQRSPIKEMSPRKDIRETLHISTKQPIKLNNSSVQTKTLSKDRQAQDRNRLRNGLKSATTLINRPSKQAFIQQLRQGV